MGEWRTSSIGALADVGHLKLQTGPFGSQLHSYDYVELGVPVVPTEAIRNRKIDCSALPNIEQAKAQELGRHRLQFGDILFARRGVQATGHIGVIRKNEEGFICGTGAIRLRVSPHQEEIDADFLSHVLACKASVNWFKCHAIGATMPNLNEGIIRAFKFRIPPHSEQTAIAYFLSAMDDKIELNRRMNETLEAMAQAIFRDWFVDFGPTRRQLAGATDPIQIMGGLTPDPEKAATLAPLFPPILATNGLPEGWEEASADQFIEFNPKEPLRRGEVAPYTDMASLPTKGSSADPPVDRQFGSGMRFRNGDALLARITPCLENGKAAYVDFLPDDDAVGWGSTEFIVLRSRAPVPQPFAYCLIRHPEFRDTAIRSMTGTSGRQRAQADTLKSFKLVRASDDVFVAFGALIVSWFKMIRLNQEQSTTLAAIRDLLLPKLMSGEIRLRDAERAVAEAAT